MTNPKLVNGAIVFVSTDVRKTAEWYREVLKFRVVENYDQPEKFAALYRDSVEIIVVQSRYGTVQSNRARFGAGFDAYLAPENPAAVDTFHSEIAARGVKIAQPPELTSYGSREMAFEDIDGRIIGVGCIRDEAVFFGKMARPDPSMERDAGENGDGSVPVPFHPG
jgi:catechol 2,3-dioxygenase-like lactoylglutathione lyase family enzyme